MFVKQLTGRTFGPYDGLNVQFPPGFSVVYGGNGTGKSTLVHALRAAIWSCAEGRFENLARPDSTASVEYMQDGIPRLRDWPRRWSESAAETRQAQAEISVPPPGRFSDLERLLDAVDQLDLLRPVVDPAECHALQQFSGALKVACAAADRLPEAVRRREQSHAEFQQHQTAAAESEAQRLQSPSRCRVCGRNEPHLADDADQAIDQMRALLVHVACYRQRVSCQLARDAFAGRDHEQWSLERDRVDRLELELLRHLACLRRQFSPQAGEILSASSGGRPQADPHKTEVIQAWQSWQDSCRHVRRLRAAIGRRDQRLRESVRRLTRREIEPAAILLDAASGQCRQPIVSELCARLRADLARQRERTQPPLMQAASDRLTALCGQRRRLILTTSNKCVLREESGEQIRLGELSRGTATLVALALRLASAEAQSGRGQLPLFLDDVLVELDTRHADAALQALAQSGQAGCQVVLFTCQKHLADRAAVLQQPVQQLAAIGPDRQLRCTDFAAAVPRASTVAATADVAEHPEDVRASGSTTDFETASVPPRTRKPPRQPGDGLWLKPSYPLVQVPSIGTQMARRLAASGVRNVADLLGLTADQMDWQELGIERRKVAQWQLEASLLCHLPEITGRDAQLLVACRVRSLADLAELSAQELAARLARLRSTRSPSWIVELSYGVRQSEFVRWIRAAAALPKDVRDKPLGLNLSEEQTSAVTSSPTRARLTWSNPIIDAPEIGPETARYLRRIGIGTIADLLARNADEVSRRLGRSNVTSAIVQRWQSQCSLNCRIGELQSQDVQLLVAAGFTTPDQIARMEPSDLLQAVKRATATKRGAKADRDGGVPDIADVSRWVDWARRAKRRRAA